MAEPDSRIRVCCVIGALTSGGTERQLLGILHQLDRTRFAPHLFTFYKHGPLTSQLPDDVPHFCYEQHHGRPPNRWWPGNVQRCLARRLESYCREHQIEVVYDRTYHVSLVVGAACQQLKTPYLNTVVENPKLGFYSTAGFWGRLKYYQLRNVYRQAFAVLCVSQGLREAAPRFFQIPDSNFYTCYNFIDQQRGDAIAQARLLRVPRTEFSDQEPVRIVAVGRLHWQKGLDVLLRAIAILHQEQRVPLRLTLVGEGPEAANLRRLAIQLGIAAIIEFEGWIQEPAPWIARADLYALPSLGEGLPNSLLEALLIGTPSIASDCDFGPRELTEAGRWGNLLPVGSVEAWAEAIRRFAESPQTAIAKATIAHTALWKTYSHEVGIERLEKWLQAAAGR